MKRMYALRWFVVLSTLALFYCLQVVTGQSGKSLPPDIVPRVIGIPLHGATDEDLKAAIAANATIPTWSYNVVSTRDAATYSGKMVGASPFTSPGTSTSVPTFIVPLII